MTERPSPYALAFGPARFESEVFPALRAEAAAHGARESVPDEVLMLPSAGALLRDLPPDPADEEHEPAEGNISEFAALLFHGFRFWNWGRHAVSLDEGEVRALVEGPAATGGWMFDAPHPSGYAQLPRNLVWAPVSADSPPEPVDGFFWSVAYDESARPLRLDLLLVLGVRPDRPGFTVAAVYAPLPAPPPGHWANINARHDGKDFGNILPGGDLRGLLALTSVAEVLKLTSRIFHHLTPAREPES